MSKLITFSRHFQKSHPKAGQPTFFVEKILNSLGLTDLNQKPIDELNDFFIIAGDGKHHTIRGGNRFKVGDKFSPRVWSAKPYASKQIVIGPDIEIKKIYNVRVLVQSFGKLGLQAVISIDGNDFQNIDLLAKNDGLSQADFLNWFTTKKGETFVGQIICWSDDVCY